MRLKSMGSPRAGHSLMTKQQQQHHVVREPFGFFSVGSKSESLLVGPKDPSTSRRAPFPVERADFAFRALGRRSFLLRSEWHGSWSHYRSFCVKIMYLGGKARPLKKNVK